MAFSVETAPLQLAALVEGVTLSLVGARSALEFDKLGIVLECETEGGLRRSYAGLFGLTLIVLVIASLRSDIGWVRLFALVEAGAAALVASADGQFKFLGQRIAVADAGLFGRLYAAAIAVVMLAVAASKPDAGGASVAAIVLLIGGCVGIAAVVDELEIVGLKLGAGEEPSGVARWFLGVVGVVLVSGGAAASRAADSSVKTAPPGPTSDSLATAVETPTPTATAPTHPVWRPQTYLQLASETSEDAAEARAAREAESATRPVCVFRSQKWEQKPDAIPRFGIVLGPVPKDEAPGLLKLLKTEGRVPSDALVRVVDDSQIGKCYSSS